MYQSVLSDVDRAGICVAVGGGLTVSVYGGKWRDSKDIDLYIQRSDLERVQQILKRNGLCDYFPIKAYDRKWIYRSHFRETIVDVIWAMANQRAQVDSSWLSGPEAQVDGLKIRLLPPEETLWNKLYIMQFDRCDWPDAMNILYASGAELNWDRMLQLLGNDRPLLAGLLSVFAWVCPGRAASLPASIWPKLGVNQQAGGAIFSPERANLLDTRPWLTPMMEEPGAG